MQVAVPARKFVRAPRRLQPARKKLRLMQNFLETIADRPSELVSGRSSDRFSELPISDYTKERLSSARFTTPTPVQAAAIPMALEGKDVLATAQTGTGKTLAFLIPIIEQLLKENTPGIAALVLVALSEGAQLSALRKGARLVVATPGRLEDFLDRKLMNFRALRMLVLD